MDERPGQTNPRAIHILVAVVLALSVVGFAAGTRPSEPPAVARERAPSPRKAEVADARSYAELRDAPLTAALTWEDAALRLAAESAGRPAKARDLDELRRVRDSHRAYDGAPPTVPHPVAQRDAGSCLSCHREGLQIGDRVASRMSHEFKSQCMQCHVPSSGTGAPGDALLADALAGDGTYGRNLFAGHRGPTRGARAWAIAPPEIPHRTFMRENCLSCHADGGSAPLRTTHPERASCQQCHAPSAALDQRRDLQR